MFGAIQEKCFLMYKVYADPLNSQFNFQTQKCDNIIDENWSFHSL